jgi:hypothetical protein
MSGLSMADGDQGLGLRMRGTGDGLAHILTVGEGDRVERAAVGAMDADVLGAIAQAEAQAERHTER